MAYFRLMRPVNDMRAAAREPFVAAAVDGPSRSARVAQQAWNEATMMPDYDKWGKVFQLYATENATGRKPASRASPAKPAGARPSVHLVSSRSEITSASSDERPKDPAAREASPTEEKGKSASSRQAAPVHPKVLDRHLQASLGRHLRAAFDDVAKAPIPDRFLKLLQELEDKEGKR